MHKLIVIAFLLCSCFFVPQRVQAHPHVFIKYEVSVLASQQQVTGFYISWVFDEMFSKDLVHQYDKNADGLISEAENEAIYQTAFTNLKSVNYLLDLVIAGKQYKIARVSDFEATIEGEHMRYSFMVPFQISLSKATKTVDLYIYDKSYYMDVEPDDYFEASVIGSDKVMVSCSVEEDHQKAYYMDQVFPYRMRFKLKLK